MIFSLRPTNVGGEVDEGETSCGKRWTVRCCLLTVTTIRLMIMVTTILGWSSSWTWKTAWSSSSSSFFPGRPFDDWRDVKGILSFVLPFTVVIVRCCCMREKNAWNILLYSSSLVSIVRWPDALTESDRWWSLGVWDGVFWGREVAYNFCFFFWPKKTPSGKGCLKDVCAFVCWFCSGILAIWQSD